MNPFTETKIKVGISFHRHYRCLNVIYLILLFHKSMSSRLQGILAHFVMHMWAKWTFKIKVSSCEDNTTEQ